MARHAPFHEQHGADSVIASFYTPLYLRIYLSAAWQDMFFAGENEIDGFQSVWVASMGHFMGLFDQPFLGIPPRIKSP